jgi:hypothetical protein
MTTLYATREQSNVSLTAHKYDEHVDDAVHEREERLCLATLSARSGQFGRPPVSSTGSLSVTSQDQKVEPQAQGTDACQ